MEHLCLFAKPEPSNPTQTLGGRQEPPSSGSKGTGGAEVWMEAQGRCGADKDMEQTRCKGRGIIQGWTLSLAEDDRRVRKQEVPGKGSSTCHLKGICANQF